MKTGPFRFPVTGDKAYVEQRVGMLTRNGEYKALHNPKRIESASLTVIPKWTVLVEKVEKK